MVKPLHNQRAAQRRAGAWGPRPGASRSGARGGASVSAAHALGPALIDGFTLIEMIIVIAIMGILLALAVPNYRTTIQASQEAVLRDDLFQMRSLIDQYTLDKQEAPQSLQDLVTAGYLREIPKDPFTHSNTTWQTDSDDMLMSPDQTLSGIDNVHSGASGTGLDGVPYGQY